MKLEQIFFLLFSLTAPLVVVVVVVVVVSFGGVQHNRSVVELNRSGPSCVAFFDKKPVASCFAAVVVVVFVRMEMQRSWDPTSRLASGSPSG